METGELLTGLAIGLGLGMLVGLQREWRGDEAEVAGVRTFSLIGLLGGVASLMGPAGIAVGLVGVIVFFVVGNVGRFWRGEFDTGMTTEIAAMVIYGVGAAAVGGYWASAVFAGGLTAVLLHFKPQLHGLIARIEHKDFRGIIQLVLIALVILPVMPDETYGPYDVLNPRKVWLMVVLIVGISLAAYAAYRLLGARVGAVLGGVLGGFISSTATTVSYARQTRATPDAAPMAALVILIASTIVNIRILIEIGAVAPGFLRIAGPPIGAMLAVMVVLSLLLTWRVGRSKGIELNHENPAQLAAALIFGGLYAVIIFVVAAVKVNFGEQALYVVAVVSGLTDVDAITLSTAEMVSSDRVSADTGWRVVLVAAMANLVFKGAAATVLGGVRLGAWVGAVFGISLAAGVAIVLLWPAMGESKGDGASDSPPRQQAPQEPQPQDSPVEPAAMLAPSPRYPGTLRLDLTASPIRASGYGSPAGPAPTVMNGDRLSHAESAMALKSPQAIQLKTVLDELTAPGELYDTLDDGRLHCYACGHDCKIPEGRAGVCRVRFNDHGTLMVPHGYVGALACDPIAKKPFFHAFVGRDALSFGMLGCDLHCSYCQNWVTSQALRDEQAVSNVYETTAAKLVDMAIHHNAPVLATTYNEPLITSEWAKQVLTLANAKGLIGAYISNGNATRRVLEYIRPCVQLYKVDLKSFQDREYRALGGQLENVKRTIRELHELGFWLEVVTLIVPGLNDSDAELTEMAEFLAGISPDIPWHVTAFHSDYKMSETDNTPVRRLVTACEIGTGAGLRYVYAGNLPGQVGQWENTRCPGCRATVIERYGFAIRSDRLDSGRCPDCRTPIPGFWSRDCVIPQENMGRPLWFDTQFDDY